MKSQRFTFLCNVSPPADGAGITTPPPPEFFWAWMGEESDGEAVAERSARRGGLCALRPQFEGPSGLLSDQQQPEEEQQLEEEQEEDEDVVEEEQQREEEQQQYNPAEDDSNPWASMLNINNTPPDHADTEIRRRIAECARPRCQGQLALACPAIGGA